MVAQSGSQRGQCTVAWGPAGASAAGSRGDIVVVVDTLSFATSTVTAVTYGAHIYPCALHDDAAAMAECVDAQTAVRREEVPARGRFSLSPLTFLGISPGTRVVLPAVNGGACTLAASPAPTIFAAGLVNATATASALTQLLEEDSALGVTIVACGEQELGATGPLLRFAAEDLIGAGGIIAALTCAKSPEAEAAEGTFLHLRDRIEDALLGSISGRELCDRGFRDDVCFAAQLDAYPSVAVLVDGCFSLWRQPGSAPERPSVGAT